MKRIEARLLLPVMDRRCLTLQAMLGETSITLGQFRMAVKRGNIGLPYADSQGSGHVTLYSLYDFLEILIYSEISKLGLPYKIKGHIHDRPISFALMNVISQYLHKISEGSIEHKHCIYYIDDNGASDIDILTEDILDTKTSFVIFNFDILLKKVLYLYYKYSSLFK